MNIRYYFTIYLTFIDENSSSVIKQGVNVPDVVDNKITPTKVQFAKYADVFIRYDPPKSSNCQFDAIADQLLTMSVSNSGLTGNVVRERVKRHMEEFDSHFIHFHSDNTVAWHDYLNTMKITTTF